jgi:RNA polymerase sigma-70 factor (ECF subfamily)
VNSGQIPEHGDDHLVAATLAGDDQAFASLVSRYKRRVFRLAGRFTRSEHELDDLCQEVFIKVYENLRQFRADAPFEHWLSRIAVRTCYDALRKQRHDKRSLPLDDLTFELRDRRWDERLSAAEAKSVLEWALVRMTPEERLVITLLELEEKTIREVAELTGWSQVNVKVRAWRARRALKKILETTHENHW